MSDLHTTLKRGRRSETYKKKKNQTDQGLQAWTNQNACQITPIYSVMTPQSLFSFISSAFYFIVSVLFRSVRFFSSFFGNLRCGAKQCNETSSQLSLQRLLLLLVLKALDYCIVFRLVICIHHCKVWKDSDFFLQPLFITLLKFNQRWTKIKTEKHTQKIMSIEHNLVCVCVWMCEIVYRNRWMWQCNAIFTFTSRLLPYRAMPT